MNIKLIAIDMDGTTFDDDHVTIPPRNIAALRAAAERGVIVAISSGRAWSQLREAAEQLGCVRCAVTANGASALDLAGDAWLWRTGFPDGQRRALVSLLLERGLPFEAYAHGDSYIQADGLKDAVDYSPAPGYGALLKRTSILPQDLNGALEGELVEKIHIFHVPADQRAQVAAAIQAAGPVGLDSAFGANMELVPPGVNKAAAVERLCARLGVKPEEVMAFGDAGNDEAMLRWAGWSFAVDNASEGAKQAAKFLTGSNRDGGVGMAVERYVLGTE